MNQLCDHKFNIPNYFKLVLTIKKEEENAAHANVASCKTHKILGFFINKGSFFIQRKCKRKKDKFEKKNELTRREYETT